MKQALFARTANLNDVVQQIRAREGSALDILQSQLTERFLHVLGTRDRERAERATAAARDFAASLGRRGADEGAGEDGTAGANGSPNGSARASANATNGPADLDALWSALETIERGAPPRARRSDRAIGRWLRKSFAELRTHDPAAHLRMAHLLRGTFGALSPAGGIEPESPPRLGARGVLARTEPPERPAYLAAGGEDVRELLRWREILVSLLPEDHRPERRMIVPGGMTCADPEGPRLSWLWIGGSSSSDVEGAFEAHVMSCDHCFEFHYRTRHAIRVLREKKAMLTETGTRERPLTQVLAQAVRERCAGFVHREALIRGA